MAQHTLLDPESQPLFANDLPLPQRIDANRPGAYVLEMREEEQWLGLVDGEGEALLTTIWGYGRPGQTATYPGPTIVAYEGTAIKANWKNKLPVEGHLLPVDDGIHLAEPSRKTLEEGYIPTVPHLHGGHNRSGSDGLPESWFTQNHTETGPYIESRIFTYDNDQEAATLWYHDHALGITRLNVYAGLAGFHLLRDDNELQLMADGVLPSGAFEVETVVQDRAFTEDGELYYPAFADDPIPGTDSTVAEELPEDYTGPFPTVLPEFFGDFILVNGMAWPNFEVEAGQYLFHLLNGSDSRFYVLQLDNPEVTLTVVGGDGGLLAEAVTVMDGDGIQEQGEQLVLAPGDRIDVVVDFSDVTGESVRLLNAGPAFEPFKGLEADLSLAGGVAAAEADDPVGQIMRFDVGDTPMLNATVADGTPLNPDYEPLDEADAALTRKLGLFEGTDPFGRIEPLLGVAEATTDINGDPVPFGPLGWSDPITETPDLGTTEVWEIYNFTEDAHPIHLHLVQFQLLEKRKIEFADADEDGIPDDVDGLDGITIGGIGEDIVVGAGIATLPEDTGWQDTIWVGPSEVMRIAAEFDLPGRYVWHCHILSHEDHEMMRPYEVVEPGAVA